MMNGMTPGCSLIGWGIFIGLALIALLILLTIVMLFMLTIAVEKTN